jgi:hypothetical protein
LNYVFAINAVQRRFIDQLDTCCEAVVVTPTEQQPLVLAKPYLAFAFHMHVQTRRANDCPANGAAPARLERDYLRTQEDGVIRSPSAPMA